MSHRAHLRRRVLRLLRRHGWNAISFQVLKPGFRYWFSEEPEGAVAYVVSGRYWLAAGAPVCAPADLAAIADGFAREAARWGRKAAFFGAVDRLVRALPDYDWLQVGSQAWWDPREWSRAVAGTSVPSQVRRARRKGLEVREIGVDELAPGAPLRSQARELQRRWRERHRLPPMRYLVDLTPFTCRRERRYFGGFLEGRLAALGVAVPIYARNGWFLESLLFDPPVPNGTAEAVVDLAMRTLGAEGAGFATTGLSALVGLGGRPRRHPGLALLMKACYGSLNGLYNFQGIERFQVRLRPDGWEPVYVLAWRRVTPGTVWAVLAAFAGGRVDRFAWQAARRRLEAAPATAWARTAELLGALLVPWSALLLAVDPIRWFGAPWMAAAWASFDLALAALFLLLASGLRRGRPWTRKLAAGLLGAVLADAWLTAAQALLYNAPRSAGWEVVLVTLACGAPLLAAGWLGALLGALRRPGRPPGRARRGRSRCPRDRRAGPGSPPGWTPTRAPA